MSSCQHPKWFSCLENQTIKPYRHCTQRILNRFCWKNHMGTFFRWKSGNISVWATQHWCWPYTKPWEISSPPCWRCLGSRCATSRMQKIMDRWTAGPSFRLGKPSILEVWGVVLGQTVWNQEICLWKPWYHPFLGGYMLHWFWERGTARVHFFSRSRLVQSPLSFKILMLGGPLFCWFWGVNCEPARHAFGWLSLNTGLCYIYMGPYSVPFQTPGSMATSRLSV